MSDDRVEELLEELIEVTRQNQRWLRIIARDNVEDAISAAFSEPWEYHLFESLDGESSFGELADRLPTTTSTIGRRLRTWQQLGIVEQTPGGQYDKITSLETLGIEIPEIEEDEDE